MSGDLPISHPHTHPLTHNDQPPLNPIIFGDNHCMHIPSFSFVYSNFRGEVAVRNVIPRRVYFGATEHYPTPCWLMEAFDLKRNEIRTFKMNNINLGNVDKQY